MDVCDCWDVEGFGYFAEYLEGFFVANAGEAVYAGAVCFFEGAFEDVWDLEFVGDGD